MHRDGQLTWGSLYAAHATSESAAIVETGRTLSYARLSALAGTAASWLDALGAETGRSVAALVATTGDAAALTVAAAATHRPLAPLNTRSTVAELVAVLEPLSPSVVVAEPAARELAEEAAALLGLRAAVLPALEPSGRRLDAGDVAADEPAAILHTSGTSGVPKAVPFAQGRLAERVRVNRDLLGIGPGARHATASPFHHIAGVGNLFVALGAGAALCSLPRFSADTWQEMLDVGTTHTTLVPTMIDRLLDQGRLDPGNLRCLQYGASPVDPETLGRLLDALPGVDLVQLYGQTEGSPLTVLTTDDHRRAAAGARHLLRSAGRPIPGVDLVLHDPDEGGVGEIWARGAHLMRPGPDGWVHTGDLATIDDEGYVTLVGRKGDMIIRGGENVHPSEVEQVLRRHPAVADVAVVGSPDRRMGEIVVAHLVAAEGVGWPSDEELRSFTRASLAGFKVPERWVVVDALPRNAAGKVLRRLL